jgi:hypothetical protein
MPLQTRMFPRHPFNDSSRGGGPPHLDQPPRRFRHEEQDAELHGGRHRTQAHHPPPRRLFAPIFPKQPAHNVRHDLAQGDEHDCRRNEPPPMRRRCELGNVQRHHEAGTTDGRPHDRAAGNHAGHGRAPRLEQGARDEEYIGDEDDALPSQRIGEQRGKRRDEEGKQRGARSDDGFVERGERLAGERGPYRYEGCGDDAGVICGRGSASV